jgi:hypothetical protein
MNTMTSKDLAWHFLTTLSTEERDIWFIQLPPKAERTEEHYQALYMQLVEAEILKLLATHPTGFTAPYIDRHLGNLGADDAARARLDPLHTWKQWGDLQGLGMATYDALCALRESGRISKQENGPYMLSEASTAVPIVSIEGLSPQVTPIGAVTLTYKEKVTALCTELGLTREDKEAWIKRLSLPKKAERTEEHFKTLLEALERSILPKNLPPEESSKAVSSIEQEAVA